MYRLVLYVLFVLEVVALALSALGQLPFSPIALIYSTAILVIVSWITNNLFVKVFKTHANVESLWITALILALIISPPQAGEYISILPLLIWAGVWSMAAKFILAINKKHIFNPAAFAVALTAITLGQSATWWIGTLYMLPFVFVGGLLITKKIRRFDLVISFVAAALVSILITSTLQTGLAVVPSVLERIVIGTPLLFFAFVMLTEPLTMPPTRTRRIIYGIFVGLLFAPALHIGSIYSTPELALLAGNILAFFLSPMRKYILTMKELKTIAKDTDEFIFTPDHPIKHKPGQYMEWTFGHKKSDNRGNRRFFTIASSPTEPDIRLGVKFYAPASSFKNAFGAMKPGETIMAGGVAGDFVLPHNKKKKLVFIAGGIGITPFRSMVKYLIDKNEKRDIILIYSNNILEDIAYVDILDAAEEKLNMKIICTLTDLPNIPTTWTGDRGQINATMIVRAVPDYRDRTFYISGPHRMVTGCNETLHSLGIPSKHIRTDYFPGFV
jgi:ferredoxin-NADP reductase/Na+-translocating ferredoxin:NAD+ oxidoreductase RnfD subunit